MREYNWKIMVLSVRAVLHDDRVEMKLGLRSFAANIADLRHLYVLDHGPPAGSELMLAHEPKPGKVKRIRISSNHGDPQFQAFVEALVAIKPEIDIRNLSAQAAHRMMGATNFVAAGPFIAVTAIVGVTAVAFLPQLIHGLDGGHAEVTATQLADPDFSAASRNVTVTDFQLQVDKTLEIETTRDTSKSVELAIPVVPPDWKPGDAVHLVLKTPDLSPTEADAIIASPTLDGILRNVLWEGLPSDEASYFRESMSVILADDVAELDYEAKPRSDLILSLAVIGVVLVIMVIVAVVVARRQRS